MSGIDLTSPNNRTPGNKSGDQSSNNQPTQLLARLLLQELSFIHSTPASQNASSPSLINALIQDAWRERATDIHLDPHSDGAMIRFRIDGQVIDCTIISKSQHAKLVNQIKTTANLDPIKTFLPHEARRTYQLNDKTFDMRITTAPCIGGEKIAIRLLDPEKVNHEINDLGLQGCELERIRDWLTNMTGMFLVAGPTGSGKTTTLYALLHELKNRSRNIMTIEDPVEYQIDGINQIAVDEKHGLDFEMGLRTILRLDPDYLMLGEIRDKASAKAASEASTSGHVLLSTIHSKDTVGTITSLRNLGMSNHEISAAVSIIVTQRLVRTLCPDCKTKKTISESDQRWLNAIGVNDLTETHHAQGCDKCSHLGYVGRTGIFSIWQLDNADITLINSGATEQEIKQKIKQDGHQTLLQIGIQKVRDGDTVLCDIRGIGQIEDILDIPQNKAT